MVLHSLPVLASGQCACTLTYEPDDKWICATWRGYVDDAEATCGAKNYLAQLARLSSPYLLNNNLALYGPWFDSALWLQQAWLPHALRLGLRYVAHVVQPGAHLDIVTMAPPIQIPSKLELQIFHELDEAQYWLHSCQSLGTRPLTY